MFWAGAAQAALITLTTSNPPGSPLIVPAGTAASNTMFIKVLADTVPPSPGPADKMLAWQFKLQIVPDSGAVGTIMFNNASKPSNYIFASSAGISATKTVGNTVLDANGFDNSSGTVVPASPGANLLAVDYTSSANATGTFGIYAVPGPAFTVWTDATPASREYANVPFAGSGADRRDHRRPRPRTVF